MNHPIRHTSDSSLPEDASSSSGAGRDYSLTAGDGRDVVRTGTRVLLHYTAQTTEGGIYETSRRRDPLICVAGGQHLIPGVSQAIIGMSPGEQKTVTVPPELAFGVRRTELEQQVPRAALPDHLSEGDQMAVTTDVETVDVWVRELRDDVAIVDANHPLAGETLVFELEVMGIEEHAD